MPHSLPSNEQTEMNDKIIYIQNNKDLFFKKKIIDTLYHHMKIKTYEQHLAAEYIISKVLNVMTNINT